MKNESNKLIERNLSRSCFNSPILQEDKDRQQQLKFNADESQDIIKTSGLNWNSIAKTLIYSISQSEKTSYTTKQTIVCRLPSSLYPVRVVVPAVAAANQTRRESCIDV